MHLAKTEWDFSDIEDVRRLNIAFFWEYSRESKAIQKRVKWLAGHSIIDDLILNGGIITIGHHDESGNLVEYTLRDHRNELRRIKKFKSEYRVFSEFRFRHQIEFISSFLDYFPNHGVREIDGFEEDYFFSAFDDNLVQKSEQSVSLSKLSELKPDRDSSKDLQRNTDHFLLGVPIAIGITKVIRQLKNLLQEKRSPKSSIKPLSISDKKLGFKKRTALEWLGTLRRFNHCGRSWNKFLELYPEPGDPLDAKTKLREKCRKAKEIIKWFDAEGQGLVVSQNKSRSISWVRE